MQIPIQNIYYLLCYAWDKLEDGQRIKVSASEYENSLELFARVLINGCKYLFRSGLEKNYSSLIQEYNGIKGKIIFRDSLNKNSFMQGRAFCEFDQYDSNTLPNQILKATLKSLVGTKCINIKLKEELWKFYWKYQDVEDITLHNNLFSLVRLHRNNSIYDFLLKICRLIFDNTVLDEKSGNYIFNDFLGNDKAMAVLFEAFIRNFYKKEQFHFKVRREDIFWDAIPFEGANYSYLPKMQTDITLESINRKIIIETKYYSQALRSRFDSDKLNSENLYQIYSYLRNIETKPTHPKNTETEGVLLYPAVGYKLNDKYKLGHHILSIQTIDLSRPWRDIHNELLDLISIHSLE